MTTLDVETRLRRALEVDLPDDGRRMLDTRVALAINQPTTAEPWRLSGARSLLRPLALAAALALAAGTVAAALTLLERVVSEAPAGIRTAWDNAKPLALEETDAGVTIRLERAYADLNQVVAFFTIDGYPDVAPAAGEGMALGWTAELRDPEGRVAGEWAGVRGGSEGDELGVSAHVHVWEGAVTQVTGTWELTFTSIGYGAGGFVPGQCTAGSTEAACVGPSESSAVEGVWRFEFELPQPAGSIITTELTATVDDAVVTLSELRISPTMITAAMALRVSGETVTSWSNAASLSITGPDGTYVTNAAYHVTQDPQDQGPAGDENVFMTSDGTDEAAGTWVITLPKLWYATNFEMPDEATTATQPVTFTVQVDQ